MYTRGGRTVDVAAKWRLNPRLGVWRTPIPFHKMCSPCSKVKFHINPPRANSQRCWKCLPEKTPQNIWQKTKYRSDVWSATVSETIQIVPDNNEINADRYYLVDYINPNQSHDRTTVIHIYMAQLFRPNRNSVLHIKVLLYHLTVPTDKGHLITCRCYQIMKELT
jgi:hypothetical protein